MRSASKPCKYCDKPRCLGKCQRTICPDCGRRCGGYCQSEVAQLVRAIMDRHTGADDKPELSYELLMTLDYIRRYIAEHGYGPAIRDIKDDLRVSSTSVVGYRLMKLESKGLITRSDRRFIARSIRLTPAGAAMFDKEH